MVIVRFKPSGFQTPVIGYWSERLVNLLLMFATGTIFISLIVCVTVL